MAIILKTNKVNLFVSSVLFVFWYHSPNFLDTPGITSTWPTFQEAVLQSAAHSRYAVRTAAAAVSNSVL
jgi:hypothetical protein